jgi:hypothetical protein
LVSTQAPHLVLGALEQIDVEGDHIGGLFEGLKCDACGDATLALERSLQV